jgi:cyclic beta-1,2-glucan synthetase
LQEQEALIVGELWSIPGFLKFALLEWLLAEANTLLSSPVSDQQPLISVFLRSLRLINNTDWVSIIEPLITFDALLREDPAEAYSCMDFDSREFYRKRIAFIAQHSDYSENQVAQAVLDLREKAPGTPVTIRVSFAATFMSAITSWTRDFQNSRPGSAFTLR